MTKRLLRYLGLICLSLACVQPLCAQDNAEGNFYKVRLASVYDGDTFKVYLACSYKLFCRAIGVRVKNIDAPEIKTKNTCEKAAAKKAKQFTHDFLTSGPIILRHCQKDKYFRLLCDVYVRNSDNNTHQEERNLATELLAQQLAVPYDGGTKAPTDWCPAKQPEKDATGHDTENLLN